MVNTGLLHLLFKIIVNVRQGGLCATPPSAKRLWPLFTQALAWPFLNPHRRRRQQSCAQPALLPIYRNY